MKGAVRVPKSPSGVGWMGLAFFAASLTYDLVRRAANGDLKRARNRAKVQRAKTEREQGKVDRSA